MGWLFWPLLAGMILAVMSMIVTVHLLDHNPHPHDRHKRGEDAWHPHLSRHHHHRDV